MNRNNERAFTLTEVLTATVIAMYIFAGVWAVFIMAWRWSHEISPQVEAERIARKVLTHIVEGSANLKDTAGVSQYPAGSYMIGGGLFYRRNGIAWATDVNAGDLPAHQDDTAGAQAINFALAPDAAGTPRSFYMETDAGAGTSKFYYQDADGNRYEIASLTEPWRIDVRFWRKYDDVSATAYDDIIDVYVSVQADILGTRDEAYEVNVEYADSVNIENMYEG